MFTQFLQGSNLAGAIAGVVTGAFDFFISNLLSFESLPVGVVHRLADDS